MVYAPRGLRPLVNAIPRAPEVITVPAEPGTAPPPAWWAMSTGLDEPARSSYSWLPLLARSAVPYAAPGYVMPAAEHPARQALRSSPAPTWPVVRTVLARAVTLRALHGSCEEASFRARPYGKGLPPAADAPAGRSYSAGSACR